EVAPSHHDVAWLHRGGKGGIDVLHAVGGQGFLIRGVQIAGRDDDVGIHVVAVLVNFHSFTPPSNGSRVGDHAGDGGGRRHSGTGQDDHGAGGTHPAHKVPVGGGNGPLIVAEHTHVSSQAGAAGGGGHGGAGLNEVGD